MGSRTRTGLMVGIVVAVCAAAPTPAGAFSFNPKDWFDSLDPTKLVGKILDQVFKWMFGFTPGELAGKVLKAVVANPDLGGDMFAPLRTGVHQLIPAAIALLILFTLSGLGFSLASDPSRAGIDVFKRLAVAIVGIVALPSLFEQFNTLVGYVAQAVISTPMVRDSVAAGLDGAFKGGIAGAVFMGVAMILLLILLCAKVVILALLAILYIATPFVMATFVDPRMSHIAGVWLQSTALIQFVPVAWSAILLAFGAIGSGGHVFDGVGLDTNYINVAVALTLLAMLVFSIPVMLRMAWIGGFIPSLRGAGTMAWGGAQMAGALGGGGAVDLPELEQNAQDAMDDAAAPPRAESDRRGGAGPTMDFGSDGQGGGAPGPGFSPVATDSSVVAAGVAPSSAPALAAGDSATAGDAPEAGDDVRSTPDATTTDGSAALDTEQAPGDAQPAATDLAAPSMADTPIGAGDVSGAGDSAGDPLPAPAAAASPPVETVASSTPAASSASTTSTGAPDVDQAGPLAASTSTSDDGAATSAPTALDGGDVRGPSAAPASIDALDVPAAPAAPAVSDPDQETPQR
jgi:hypothetical protein